MRTLRHEKERGSLKGLRLSGLKTVLHELFTDDTSLFIRAQARNFQVAIGVIELFEKASGASLNVQKSMVMALGNRRQNNWLRDVGCDVASSGRRFKFLGVLSGMNLQQAEITQHIVLPRTEEKSHAPNLWGYNADGKPKTVLIAWDKLLRPLECGGLAWSDLQDRMHSQLASKCIRILKQESELVNWIRLATAIMQKHNTGKEQSSWTLQDCLLLSPCTRVKHAPVFSQILASWSKIWPYLTIPENTLEIPRELSLLQLERLLTASGYNLEGNITKWRKWCRKLNWKAMADLINDQGGWKHMEDE
ncbi:hypothetical protein R1sor_016876 [Riccia sorocarpa]|uniref:Reverse transcriptase domain-containing protein n=1 Tax=Riccia sorocarpa TaxID=122646 RepID=A0ABD3HJL2_9MARC